MLHDESYSQFATAAKNDPDYRDKYGVNFMPADSRSLSMEDETVNIDSRVHGRPAGGDDTANPSSPYKLNVDQVEDESY